MNIEALRSIANTLFEDIRQISFDGVGVTRDSYGKGESLTAEYLINFAIKAGLTVIADRAGNIHFSLPDQTINTHKSSIWCGSHLDSVPQGGNYDGLAGVIAGILCLIAQKNNTETDTPAYPLTVVGFRGEESAGFGKPYLGSSALFGKLSAQDLALVHHKTHITLADSLKNVGADIAAISTQSILIDPQLIRAYIELHIEQGPVLVDKNLPAAIVSGIRGNVRHSRINCLGIAGHSGTIPRALRQDTVFACSDLIMRMDAHWQAFLDQGADLVVTCGIMMTDPTEHAITRIPSKVSFSFDARSNSIKTLDDFHQLLEAECLNISRERTVKFEFDQPISAQPAVMDTHITEQLLAAMTDNGLQPLLMPSGAGHDAATFAGANIPAGMIFIRNPHGSHNPEEAMSLDDFMVGVKILNDTVINFK